MGKMRSVAGSGAGWRGFCSAGGMIQHELPLAVTPIRALRENLVSADVATRRRAARSLCGRDVAEVRAALPELIAAVWDIDPAIRVSALDAIRVLGPSASLALPAIAHALEDPDPDVRRHAASTRALLIEHDALA